MLGRWRSANQEDRAKNKDLTSKGPIGSIQIQHIQTSQLRCLQHHVTWCKKCHVCQSSSIMTFTIYKRTSTMSTTTSSKVSISGAASQYTPCNIVQWQSSSAFKDPRVNTKEILKILWKFLHSSVKDDVIWRFSQKKIQNQVFETSQGLQCSTKTRKKSRLFGTRDVTSVSHGSKWEEVSQFQPRFPTQVNHFISFLFGISVWDWNLNLELEKTMV